MQGSPSRPATRPLSLDHPDGSLGPPGAPYCGRSLRTGRRRTGGSRGARRGRGHPAIRRLLKQAPTIKWMVSRAVYQSGELAQRDLWFPPVDIPPSTATPDQRQQLPPQEPHHRTEGHGHIRLRRRQPPHLNLRCRTVRRTRSPHRPKRQLGAPIGPEQAKQRNRDEQPAPDSIDEGHDHDGANYLRRPNCDIAQQPQQRMHSHAHRPPKRLVLQPCGNSRPPPHEPSERASKKSRSPADHRGAEAVTASALHPTRPGELGTK